MSQAFNFIKKCGGLLINFLLMLMIFQKFKCFHYCVAVSVQCSHGHPQSL